LGPDRPGPGRPPPRGPRPADVDRQIRRLGVVLLLAFLLLFLQLNRIQVLQASKLANAPGNPRKLLDQFTTPRGDIQSADGVVLARSVPTNDLYKYQRQYPLGPLFAQVVGYDSLIYGEDGVEATYNSELQGHSIPLRHLSDILTPRTQTGTVTLTLDSQLQATARFALGNRTGAVVALNPSTGAVLAMYSNPSYDPNPLASHDAQTVRRAWTSYQADPNQPMLARAFRRSYPPGSTFKVVTSAAVLDRDPGLASVSFPSVSSIPLPDSTRTLSNFAGESCGGTLPALLQVSCDTGFAQLGLQLGADNLASEAMAFGFDQAPPIDLPAPAASAFPPAASFARDRPGLAYSAIGQQDVSATALQMALVAAGIADHGQIMVPHVMAQVRDRQGNLVKAWKPRVWLTATSPATAQAVTGFMVGVVQGGTAQNMALPGVEVAAKTGTAQTGGANTATANWMIAFAPAQAPSVAVAVVVPPQPGLGPDPQGATIAGPVARAVLSAALARGGR
jgi:peptidoglycan glycosyltransferase